MNWLQIVPSASAAFLGSFVECVEAATIVLAVGTVRGWRSALAGVGLGLVALIALIGSLGPALSHVPERALQLAVGLLLLLFGMRWLRKAVLRGAGVIALHDEDAVFRRQTATLGLARWSETHRLDPVAMATAFKAVLLEGVEVAFIVLAVAAVGPDLLSPALLGAAAAACLVTVAAWALRRPLARVPENALKLGVGVLISAFGIFWSGEGLGLDWPGGELCLPALACALLATAWLGVRLAGRASRPTVAECRP